MLANDNIGLFDMDGSLFGYEESLRQKLSQLASPDEPSVGDLWDVEKQAYMKARMRLIKSQPGFWLNLPPLRWGFEVFRIAREIGFSNHILTKGPKSHPLAWAEKVQCCQEHFGEDIDVHVTSDKGMVYGKFLYDDYPDYALRWLAHRPRGLVIMPLTKSNESFRHPQVLNYAGDTAVARSLLQACFDRQPGETLKF